MLSRRRGRAGRGPRRARDTAAGEGRPHHARWGDDGAARAGERGSGTAVGMAIMFPMLILVLVAISLLSESGRFDQALQNAANRAARAAALCCKYTGGPDGAEAVARAGLAAAEDAAAANRIFCNNDFVGDSRVAFVDVSGADAAVDPAVLVPPGGTVHVFVTCRVPPEILGGFGFPGLDARRGAEGVASIDPYRSRR